MTDLWQLGATQLAQGYSAGAFTPLDAVDACLGRIEECRPTFNHIVGVDATGARNAAAASSLRWHSGQPLGPIDGIPITVKDNLHVAGLSTGWGSRLLHSFSPERDEVPVCRLRKAGTIVLGKTTLPEFAMQGMTSNLATGTTSNPWDLALTPGGSSGGAAVAAATGCGPLALATDGGGSIRRPASHCGVVGFKPSSGLVPRGAGLPNIFLDWEVVGGIGRRLVDVRVLMEVLARSNLDAPSPYRARIFYVPQFAGHPVDPGIAACVRQAASRFEALGHEVEEAQCFDLAEPVNALWPVLSAVGLAWMVERAACFPEFALATNQALDTSRCGLAAQDSLAVGRATQAAAFFDVLVAVDRLRHSLSRLFRKHDVILTPATAALPWPAAQSHPAEINGQAVGPRGHAVFTAFANAAGLPAVAMPCGSVGRLPTGFQLVGPSGADAAVLALAEQYERTYAPEYMWPEAEPSSGARLP